MRNIWLYITVIVLSMSITSITIAGKWSLSFEELPFAPDSIVRGIEDYEMIGIWRRDQGLCSRDTFFHEYKWNIYDRQFSEFTKGMKLSLLTGTFQGKGVSGYWNLIEQEFNIDDPDTTHAHFRYIKSSDEYISENSRYKFVVGGDTICTFAAVNERYPTSTFLDIGVYPDSSTVIQFQRITGEYMTRYGTLGSKITIHAIINGIDINEVNGYQNVIAAKYFDSQLFFLFEKNGKWGWYFDGTEHPDCWDHVFYHYGQGGGYVLKEEPSYKYFNAKKDRMWYIIVGTLNKIEN